MLPGGPERKRVESSRVVVPVEYVPVWAKGGMPDDLRMVPLIWRRTVQLPPAYRLDAWYLWNSVAKTTDWVLDPTTVTEHRVSDPEAQFRLKLLVYDADFDTKTRSHRLGASGLLSSLALKSEGSLWVVPEPDGSISIWTDIAYQLYFAQLE